MKRGQTRRARYERERRASRIMLVIFAAILFSGLFLQVAMMSRLSRQTRDSQQLEKEIRELNATQDNLRLALNQCQSLDRVATQAVRLGMDKPGDGQIRVVNLPLLSTDTSAQSVDAIGSERME